MFFVYVFLREKDISCSLVQRFCLNSGSLVSGSGLRLLVILSFSILF